MKNDGVFDVKPSNQLVSDIKPSNEMVLDVKPQNISIDPSTQQQFRSLARGQSMGLLLALTYSEEVMVA